MAKNTGKPSEEAFEEHLDRMGKRSYYYRCVDAAEVRGRTGKIGFTRPAPSDYVVTHNGVTFYAEVKSTQHPTAFQFSLLRTVQSGIAKQVLAAGGGYWVFLHHLPTNIWYRIPYQFIQSVKDLGKSSVPWANLERFQYALS